MLLELRIWEWKTDCRSSIRQHNQQYVFMILRMRFDDRIKPEVLTINCWKSIMRERLDRNRYRWKMYMLARFSRIEFHTVIIYQDTNERTHTSPRKAKVMSSPVSQGRIEFLYLENKHASLKKILTIRQPKKKRPPSMNRHLDGQCHEQWRVGHQLARFAIFDFLGCMENGWR